MGADNRVIAVVPSLQEFQQICVTLAADDVVVQQASGVLEAVLAHVHAQSASWADAPKESGGDLPLDGAAPQKVFARGPVILYDTDSSDDSSLHGLKDWRDVLRQFLSLHSGARVVFVSRLADEDMWLEVLEAGGHDLLSKPFSESELRQAVRRALLLNSHALATAA